MNQMALQESDCRSLKNQRQPVTCLDNLDTVNNSHIL
jgi:hypothetical protein